MKKKMFWKMSVIALICAVWVTTSCTDPVNPPILEGKGSVSINFGGGNARTLLPSEIDISKLHYVLNFTQADGSGNLTETQNGSGQLTLQLNIGTWNLVIRGYNSVSDATNTSKALVSYTQNGIVIPFGNNIIINAKLLPNLDNLTQNGSGTLRYDITFPVGATGVLKVYTYPANTLVGSPVVLSATENHSSLELASGYYDISVNMEYQGKIKIWSEIAHINDNAITEVVVGTNDFSDLLPSPGPVDIYLSMDKFSMTDEGSGIFSVISPITLDKRTGDIRTITVDDLVVVEWKVGNIVLGTGNSITLNSTIFPSGIYTLNLTFLKNGKYWLGSIRFEVTVTGNLPDDCFELITNANAYNGANIGTYRIVRGITALPNDVYIPAKYNGLPVTEIGSSDWSSDRYRISPFDGKTNINAIYIPEGIKTIGHYAFYGCTNLKSLTIPEGVTAIASRVFQNCSSLTSVTFPASVLSFGGGNTGGIFYGCTSLTSIVVNENNPNFSSEGGILFNKAKTTILDYFTASGSVVIPEGITIIGDSAFYGCTSLTSITFPTTLTSINYQAFYNCKSLTNIIIPEGVTTVGGQYVFSGCTSLTSIKIPASLTNITRDAFYGCTSLTNIIVDENNPNYTSEGGILYNKAKTEIRAFPSANGTVVIPVGVTTIGSSAFYGCANLTSIVISEGVSSIGSYAFGNCTNLTTVKLSASVVSIGGSAFGSYNIISVTFEGIISAQNFAAGGGGNDPTFRGDLRDKYLAPDGGVGTYTRVNSSSNTWSKQ
jgi:hypothetical protein